MMTHTTATITPREFTAIEKVFRMGHGYVLDFSDRTFAEFFTELGIDINAEFPNGSKANRLRALLRSADPARVAQVLDALLAHSGSPNVPSGDLKTVRNVVARLQGTHVAIANHAENTLPRMEVSYRKKLGAGAFGSVWRATDALLERDIAVKFLTSTDQAMDEAALIREARSLARLSHPNLVTIFAAAWLRHPETGLLAPAITMELLQGETLDEWWTHSRSRDDVLRVARGIVAGVIATHEAGLIHGDLHAGNVIILADTTAKLIDWRYHDTFLQRSTSHRHNEMEAEQRRVIDQLGTLFSKQGMERECAAFQGKGDLHAIAVSLDDFLVNPSSALPMELPPLPPPPHAGRQELEAKLNAARSSAVVISGGVTDLTGDRMDAVNGEIWIGDRDDVTFQLRIPCGAGGIRIMTVPYNLLRSAWVDVAGRLNVALEWPLAWDGREVIFERGRRGSA